MSAILSESNPDVPVSAIAAPSAVNDTFSVDEETLLIGYVGLNDSDDDSDSTQWSFQLTDGASTSANGNFTFNADGTFSFLPQVEFSGAVYFEYVLCDPNGPPSCDTAIVNITVVAVNDGPIATGELVVGNEDAVQTISILSNDVDPDGNLDTNSLTIIAGPTNGVAVFDMTGSLVYTPTPDYAGNDTIFYRVCDDGIPSPVLCDSAQVVVVILPINDAPVAQNDAYSTNEDVFFSGDVSLNDNDVDNPANGLLYSIVDSSSAGMDGQILFNNSGVFTYIPNTGFNGLVSFTYQVCDPGLLCDTATVSIAIGSVNDAPTAVDDTASTNEEVTVVINVLDNDFDPDGQLDTNAVSIFGGVPNGTAQVNSDGTISFTPNLNYVGVTVFQYVICDTAPPALCDTANIIVTVLPINDAPVAAGDGYNMDEDDSLTGADLGANDSDVDDANADLSWTLIPGSSAAANGTLVLNANGTFDYTPVTDFNGTVTFDYELCDDGMPSLCDTATASVFIAPVQDPIIANDDFANMTPGLVILISNVIANDYDSLDAAGGVDPTSLVIITNATNGMDTAFSNGTISYTPNIGFTGLDSIQYAVCDVGNPLPPTCDTAWFFIDVNTNGLLAFDDFIFVNEDDTAVVDLLANDSAGIAGFDTSSLAVLTPPIEGVVTINPDGTVNYVPDPEFNGSDVFTYSICDTTGYCSNASVSITIIPQNDPPSVMDDAVITAEDTPVNMDVLLNDSDPLDPLGNMDTTSVVVVNGPSNGTATVQANGTIDYTPNPDFTGIDTIEYVACDDGNGPPPLCDTAAVFITVTPVNDVPVITDATGMPVDTLTFSAIAGIATDICLDVFDVDGDTVQVTGVLNGPLNGIVTNVANGDTCFTYTPNSGFFGTDTLDVVVCDPFGGCDTAQVIFSVLMNLPPVIVDALGSPIDTLLVSTPEDALVIICPGVADPDLDAVDVTAFFGGPSNGSISGIADGDTCFTYTPNGNYDGMDTVSIVVCDTVGLCDTVLVIVEIIGSNDFPIINDDSVSTMEDVPLSIDILANDYDTADATGAIDTASVQIVGGPDNGIVTINPNGSLNYVPDPNFNGIDTMLYVVCDNGEPTGLVLCDTALVIIVVTPVNDSPIIVDTIGNPLDTIFVSGLSGTAIAVCPEAVDVDGDSLDVSGVINGPLNGSVGGVADGDTCFTYTSDQGFFGMDTLVAIVCDAVGACDSVIVIFNVYLNDPPFAVDDTILVNTGTTTTIDNLANDTDPNGDPITTTAANAVNGTVVINANGTLDYTPDPGFCGVDTIQYTVCDSLNACDSAIVLVDVNCAPIAVNDSITTDQDLTVVVSVLNNDSDPDGDPITVTSAAAGSGVVVINIDGSLSYTPDPGFCGTDSITYTICDIQGLCDTAVVYVEVLCTNDPPIAVDDSVGTGYNQSVDVDVLNNDRDPNGDPLSVTSASAQNGIVVIGPGGLLTYTPTQDFCGTDTITYTICDTEPLCDTGIVVVEVECPPDQIAIPQGFSPNGDAYGQAWVIAGLQEFPQAEVLVFNRWGSLVFNAQPYNNDWEGSSNQGEFFGDELPVGTYFYVLELNDEAGTKYSGYVYLNR
jgi:gliding motility-associated-like protein